MRGEDIDLMLIREGNIVPSSGFAVSVMDAVTREATAPPPIPFPWKRALPGLGWCLAVNIAFFVMGRASNSRQAHATSAAPGLSTVLGGAGWIAATLLVSLVSVGLSMRLARR
jgi:hypothetical protein